MFSQIVVPKGLYPELNPLDTSGGHSATLHSMRQTSSLTSASPQQPPAMQQPPSPPPSLSSSPLSSDEDMVDSSYHQQDTYYSAPTTWSSNSCNLSLPPPSSFYQYSLPPLAVQEVAMDRIPSSEDQRQLRALRLQL